MYFNNEDLLHRNILEMDNHYCDCFKNLESSIKSFNRTSYLPGEFSISHDVILAFSNAYLKKIEEERSINNNNINVVFEEYKIMRMNFIFILENPMHYNGYNFSNYSNYKLLIEEDALDQFHEYCIDVFSKTYPTSNIADILSAVSVFNTLFWNTMTPFFNSNVNINKKEIFDMRKAEPSERWRMKCRILNILKENPNKKIKEIASIFKVDWGTVNSVRKRLRENPDLTYEDLHEKPRGPKENPYNVISKDVLDDLENVLCNEIPDTFKLNYSSWSCKCIQEYLKKKHDLDVSIKYLYYFLAKNNITSKVGRRRNPKQSKIKKSYFENIEFPKILAYSNKLGAEILFEDETHVMQGYNIRGYAPRGSRTTIGYSTNSKHTDHSLVTFMGMNGFFKSFSIKGTVDSEQFINCIEQIHQEYPDKKFIIICDNSRVHTSKMVNEWLDSLYKLPSVFARLEFLPVYCPELNPVEYFNNHFKLYLREKNLKSSNDVTKATNEYLKFYKDINAVKRIKSFFNGEGCCYTMRHYLSVANF